VFGASGRAGHQHAPCSAHPGARPRRPVSGGGAKNGNRVGKTYARKPGGWAIHWKSLGCIFGMHLAGHRETKPI